MTPEELHQLFADNISSLISDKEVHTHIVDVLDSFVCDRKLPTSDTSDAVAINTYFEQGKEDALTQLGDYFLFLCGFFPEFAYYKKRPGIGFYVGKGIKSYNYALYLSQTNKTGKHTLLSKLSDGFIDNTNALLILRRNLRGREIVLDFRVLRSLRRVLNYQPDLKDLLVVSGGGEPKEKYVLSSGYLRRVK